MNFNEQRLELIIDSLDLKGALDWFEIRDDMRELSGINRKIFLALNQELRTKTRVFVLNLDLIFRNAIFENKIDGDLIVEISKAISQLKFIVE